MSCHRRKPAALTSVERRKKQRGDNDNEERKSDVSVRMGVMTIVHPDTRHAPSFVITLTWGPWVGHGRGTTAIHVRRFEGRHSIPLPRLEERSPSASLKEGSAEIVRSRSPPRCLQKEQTVSSPARLGPQRRSSKRVGKGLKLASQTSRLASSDVIVKKRQY